MPRDYRRCGDWKIDSSCRTMTFRSGKKKGQKRCVWCDVSKTCKPRRRSCLKLKKMDERTGEHYTVKRGKNKYQRKLVFKSQSGKRYYWANKNGKKVKRYIKKADKPLVSEAMLEKTHFRKDTARPKGIRIGRKDQRKGRLIKHSKADLQKMNIYDVRKLAVKKGISMYKTRDGKQVLGKTTGMPIPQKKSVLISKILKKQKGSGRKGGRYYPYY